MATLFLCGDVMTGRGVDRILPHHVKPHLFERFARSAEDYVMLAESANGRIPRPVPFEYVWGDALAEIERRAPDARIANVETAITTSEHAWPGKDIHYRMHPANAECLRVARIDCAVLANNHVLDWGRDGLAETLETLHAEGIATAGAGASAREAAAPAAIRLRTGARVLVFAYAAQTSGVPPEWKAGKWRSGVNFLKDLSQSRVDAVAAQVEAHKRPGDIVVASIHWGGNWGYAIEPEERAFAHALVERAGVDVVHGHSSHHAKQVEVHRGRAILYGCGDLINDYEGIALEEEYAPQIAMLHFLTLDDEGRLETLDMMPLRRRRMRLERLAA